MKYRLWYAAYHMPETNISVCNVITNLNWSSPKIYLILIEIVTFHTNVISTLWFGNCLGNYGKSKYKWGWWTCRCWWNVWKSLNKIKHVRKWQNSKITKFILIFERYPTSWWQPIIRWQPFYFFTLVSWRYRSSDVWRSIRWSIEKIFICGKIKSWNLFIITG